MWDFDVITRYKDHVDVLQKAVVGLGVGVAAVGLTTCRDSFERSKTCSQMQIAVIDSVRTASPTESELQARIELVKETCDVDEKNLLKILKDLSKNLDIRRQAELERKAPVVSGGDEPPVSPSTAPTKGWVALGFFPDQAAIDINFDPVRPDGSAADAKLALVTPLVGRLVKARWSINVRKGPADWSAAPVAVLGIGQCARVLEGRKEFRVVDRTQLWLEVVADDCRAPVALTDPSAPSKAN